MNWDGLLWKSVEYLLPVVLLLVSMALTLAVAWLRKQTQVIGNADLRAAADATISQLRDALYSSVDAVSQQWVNDLKKNKEDGKLTTEEKRRAKEAAIAEFLRQLNETQKELAEGVVGNLSKWAATEVESYLGRQKWAIAGK